MQTDWTTLQQQARVRNIDVVVKGTINGQVRELSYRPFLDDYAFDALPSVSLSRTQLQTLIEGGDTLTVMGVPPREGIAPTSRGICGERVGRILDIGPAQRRTGATETRRHS